MFRALLSHTSISLQQRLLHREFWLGLILERGLPVIIPLLAWLSIFNFTKTETLEGWSSKEMASYYILSLFISTLSNTEFHRDLSDMVHRGTLDQWLVRPISFLQLCVGTILSRLLILLIPGIAILGIAYAVDPELPLFSVSSFITAMITLPLSLLLFVLMSTSIGLSAFWLIHTESSFALATIIFQFFGGIVLPLSFLPRPLQLISKALPLRSAVSDPITAMLNHGTPLLPMLIKQSLWCFVLFLLVIFLWKKGIHRYDAAGG